MIEWAALKVKDNHFIRAHKVVNIKGKDVTNLDKFL